MIQYPYLQEQPSSRRTMDTFRGLNLNERIGEGELCRMKNLTSDHYPVLSPRGKRGNVGQANDPTGIYSVSGTGTFVIDKGRLYFHRENGYVEMEPLVAGSFGQGPQRFALMGKNLIVVPDMKYIDIDRPTHVRPMGELWQVSAGKLTAVLCDREGQVYQDVAVAPEAPTAVGNMALWLDTSQSPRVLMQYTALTAQWVTIPTVYVKLTGLGDHHFEEGEGVTISGLEGIAAGLNGSHVIQRVSHGEIIIIGILDEDYEQDCAAKPVTIERKVPELDYIVEAGNRLWGCKSDVNEIYGSKLGDFKNWNVFSGLSTDSWAANVGSPGSFTGAVNHGGYPVFYKADMKHKVWPSSTGAHQLTSIPCAGVMAGCDGSLAAREGTVLYLSHNGVCMDDGSGPVKISHALDAERYHSGVGAVLGDKYYLSMVGSDGERSLYVYDLRRQLWHREDAIDIMCMASDGKGSLIAAQKDHGWLWDLTGNRGTLEEPVAWSATTGDLMLSTPDHQYISRLTLRLSLEQESRLDIYAQYDHEDLWVKLGTAYGRRPGSFSLPLRPRRCDHLRLKLEGLGMGKVYSMTLTLEKGSELQ